MALLNNRSKIMPSVFIDLVFEDDIYKQMLIHENDIVTVTYNKEGLAHTITGRVTQIGNGEYTRVSSVPRFYGASGIAHYDTVVSKSSNAGDYMIIDGSGEYAGNVEVVYLHAILNCNILNKYSENASIMSPNSDCCGTSQITNMRIYNGKLQVSTDYGQSWKDAGDVSSENGESGCNCNNNTNP